MNESKRFNEEKMTNWSGGPENEGSFTGERKETEKKVPIAIYDPHDQFTVEKLKTEYADWASHYQGDAELTAINFERTRALRKIGSETRTGGLNRLHMGGDGLNWAVDNTPREVGMNFQAHGIAGKLDAVMELDELLKGGIKPDRTFYTMNFAHQPEAGPALGADRPKTEGGFIVIGDYNKQPAVSGIKFVVVGEENNRVLDILKHRYPAYTFIPWNEAPKFLTDLANKVEGKNIVCENLTDENRPYYHVAPSSHNLIERVTIPIENSTPTTTLPDNDTPDVW